MHHNFLEYLFFFQNIFMVLYLKQLVGLLKRQLILAEIMHFFFQDKCSCILFIITKELSEPEECYVNIYLFCNDKLESAPPGYFGQTAKVDKQPGANKPSAQGSIARTGLNP